MANSLSRTANTPPENVPIEAQPDCVGSWGANCPNGSISHVEAISRVAPTWIKIVTPAGVRHTDDPRIDVGRYLTRLLHGPRPWFVLVALRWYVSAWRHLRPRRIWWTENATWYGLGVVMALGYIEAEQKILQMPLWAERMAG